jgi:hypothetical protein
MSEIKARVIVGEYWYEGRVGEVFKVFEIDDEGDAFVDPEDLSQRRFIHRGSYEIVTEDETPKDNVNQPNHYTQSKFETIEVIEEITAGYSDGFVAYALGNSLKYIARAPFKHGDGGLEDLKKAKRYIEFAIERIERKG